MITRLFGAVIRALLVLCALAIPSFFLPSGPQMMADLTTVIAFLLAMFVLIEYGFAAPSFLEFRFAAPFNRIRFMCFVFLLVTMSLLFAQEYYQSDMTTIVGGLSRLCYGFLDFPFSPVRIAAPSFGSEFNAGPKLAFALALIVLFIGYFLARTRMFKKQARDESFNVWLNLPTFTPSRFADPAKRLRLVGFLCIILGIILPYFFNQFILIIGLGLGFDLTAGMRLNFWAIILWAWVPFNLILRGVALLQIAKYFSASDPRPE